MLAVDYTYKYPRPSKLEGGSLSLASYNEVENQPYFFSGRIAFPDLFSQQLGLLHQIVQTHFFKPMPAQLDPIVTCSDEYVRFEGFSSCCGVYVRMDCITGGFDIDHLSNGTTNVDFNSGMQVAIRKLASSKESSLQIGTDEFVLHDDSGSISEKRVKLPLRWLKGLGDIQNLQSKLDHRFSVTTVAALDWFRRLPKGRGPSHPVYIGTRGRGLYLSPRNAKGLVKVIGLNRLKVVEPLLYKEGKLDVWSNDELGVSAWTITNKVGRFTIVISPDLYRGFSGEGQLLSYLSSSNKNEQLKAMLHWQSELKVEGLSRQIDMSQDKVNIGLQQLSAEGLLGFDLSTNSYFHRQLPFDLSSIKSLQPRLKSAEKLVEENAVVSVGSENTERVFKVTSNETNYRVTLSETGDRCNCSWFERYQGNRGPCKHLLAVQIHCGE